MLVRLREKKVSAFSLVELIVASGIAAGVLLGFLVLLSSIADKQRSTSAFERVQQRSRGAMVSLKADIESALRINGTSGATIRPNGSVRGVAGLARGNGFYSPSSPRTADQVYDSLSIVKAEYGNYAAEIDPDSIYIASDGRSGHLRLLPPDSLGVASDVVAEDFNVNVLRFVYESLKEPRVVALSNGEITNLIMMHQDSSGLSQYAVHWWSLQIFDQPTTDFDPAEFQGIRTTVTPVSRVRWYVNPSAQLIRQQDDDVRIVAENVVKFHVDFTFNNLSRSDRSIEVVAPDPNLRLSHPRDRRFIATSATNEYGDQGLCTGSRCGDPATQTLVGFQDISQAFVTLIVKEEKRSDIILTPGGEVAVGTSIGSGSGYEPASINTGFVDFGNFFTFGTSETANPFSFLQSSSNIVAVGADISCSVNDPTCRCKPENAQLFNNPTFGTPDWVGYGRYVGHPEGPSAYCRCGTGGDNARSDNPATFYPPETAQGRNQVPAWSTPNDASRSFADLWEDADNERIVACAKFTGGANTYAWRNKFPVHFVLHQAIEGPFRSQFVSSQRDASTGEFTWYPARFDQLYSDYIDEVPGAQDVLRCRLSMDYNDGEFRKLFAMGSHNVNKLNRDGTGPAQPWVEKCACRDYRHIRCYHGLSDPSSQEIQCDSWSGETTDGSGDPDKKVYVLGDTLKNSMEAAHCQCFEWAYAGMGIPTSHGHHYSMYWDFRADLSDYPPGSGSSAYQDQLPDTFTSAGGTSTDFKTQQGFTQNVAGHRFRNWGSFKPHIVDVTYRPNSSSSPVTESIACNFGNFSNCWGENKTFANRSDLTTAQKVEAYSQLLPEFRIVGYGGSRDPAHDVSAYCHPSCRQHREYDPDDPTWPSPANPRGRATKIAEMKMAITGVDHIDDLPSYCRIRNSSGAAGGAL